MNVFFGEFLLSLYKLQCDSKLRKATTLSFYLLVFSLKVYTL